MTQNSLTTAPAGHSHGSVKSYIVGIILSAILTIIPFALVMQPTLLPRTLTLILIVVCAVAQLFVQLVYFLHMDRKSESGWNLMSFIFALIILFILIVLSVWIIWSMHNNMMIH